MKPLLHKKFKKQYKNLRPNEQKRCVERLLLFEKDQNNKILNNHALGGNMKPLKSINITGDIRALYELLDNGAVAHFIKLGTHSELYR